MRSIFRSKCLLFCALTFLFPVHRLHAAKKRSCQWMLVEIESKRDFDDVPTVGTLEEIGMNKSVHVKYPNACRTSGLGTCLGIGIINIKNRSVHLAHIADQEPGNYNDILAEAIREAKNLQDLKVVITGVFFDSEFVEHGKEYSAALRARLAELGFKKNQIIDRLADRVGGKHEFYSIFIDTHAKKIYLARLDLDDEFD